MSLPSTTTLPPPAALITRPPYIVFVIAPDDTKLFVESSHIPTIKYLHNYLRHSFRAEYPQAVRYSKSGLVSAIEFSTLFTVDKTYALTVVLNFLESVLGYETVWHTTWRWGQSGIFQASKWELRRKTAFGEFPEE